MGTGPPVEEFAAKETRPSTLASWSRHSKCLPHYPRHSDTMTSTGHLVDLYGLDGNGLPWFHCNGHYGFGLSPYLTSTAGYMGPHGNVGLNPQAYSEPSSSLFSPAHHQLDGLLSVTPDPIPLHPRLSTYPDGVQSINGLPSSLDLAELPTSLIKELGGSVSASNNEGNLELPYYDFPTVNTPTSWESISSDVCYPPKVLVGRDEQGEERGKCESKSNNSTGAKSPGRRVDADGIENCEDRQNRPGWDKLEHLSSGNCGCSNDQNTKL